MGGGDGWGWGRGVVGEMETTILEQLFKKKKKRGKIVLSTLRKYLRIK